MSDLLPNAPVTSNPKPGSYVVDGVRYAADSGGELPKPATIPPLKSGFLTSSFWAMIIGIAVTLVMTFKARLDPNLAGVLLGALPLVYAYLRKQQALGHARITADLLAGLLVEVGTQFVERPIMEHPSAEVRALATAGPDMGGQARGAAGAADNQTIGQSDNQTSAKAVARGLPSRLSIVLLIGAALATAGCATDTGSGRVTNAVLVSAGNFLGRVAFATLANAAQSAAGGQKIDLAHSAAAGLWAQSTSILTSGDVQRVVSAWSTPPGAAISPLTPIAVAAASAFARADPQTPAARQAVVESLAHTLSESAFDATGKP